MIFHSIVWQASACVSLHSPSHHLTNFKPEFALFATMSCQHRMERQLTIDVQEARSFRKHSPMCFSAHMAPVFVQQLELRLSLPFRKHLHVPSLLQLLVIVFHYGLQEARYIGKVLHLHLMTV